MKEFDITIRSFQQVQDFVSLAMVQPFDVLVCNEKQQINGKSFIGMFSLDYRRPVFVRVCCSDEEFLRFQRSVAQCLS